jgi:hypothetical protein
MTNSIDQSRLRRALLAAGIAALLAAQLFVFLPLTLYSGNSSEFVASFAAIALKFLRPAAFLILLLALLGGVLPARANTRLRIVLAVLGVVVWLQGNLLVWNYGALDGRLIDWKVGLWRGAVDAALWIGALLLAVRCSERAGRALVMLACVTFLLSLLGALSVMVASGDQLRGREVGDSQATLEQILRFSTQRNVLHIVADGVQSDVFQEILADGERGRELAAALDGFVLFEDHLGAFPFTHMSVPAILSGQAYDNSMPREAFFDAALGKDSDSILNAAAAAGYEIDIAVATGLETVYARGAVDNLYPLTSSFHSTTADFAAQNAATLFDLVLFRAAPHFLKRWIYNDQRWLTQRLLSGTGYMNLASFSHASFLRTLQQDMRADRPAPVYKMMHLMVSHEPMATTDDCRYAGRLLPTERAAVTAQSRCGLIEIAGVLRRMKALGIYDSATIVLMADHGAWVPPTAFIPESDPTRLRRAIPPKAVALAVPLFAVKLPGARGALRTSSVPSTITDTPATIAAAAGIAGDFPGRNAFELSDDEARTRHFRVYQPVRGEWQLEFLAPMQQFEVRGRVLDGHAWTFEGILSPGGSGKPQTPGPVAPASTR